MPKNPELVFQLPFMEEMHNNKLSAELKLEGLITLKNH